MVIGRWDFSVSQSKMADNRNKDPTRLTKERITVVLLETINEGGKIAKSITSRSNSKEVYQLRP